MNKLTNKTMNMRNDKSNNRKEINESLSTSKAIENGGFNKKTVSTVTAKKLLKSTFPSSSSSPAKSFSAKFPNGLPFENEFYHYRKNNHRSSIASTRQQATTAATTSQTIIDCRTRRINIKKKTSSGTTIHRTTHFMLISRSNLSTTSTPKTTRKARKSFIISQLPPFPPRRNTFSPTRTASASLRVSRAPTAHRNPVRACNRWTS